MILVIDNYDSFTYNLVQAIGSFGVETRVERNDAITLDDIERMAPSAIILSPGPGNPDSAGITLAAISRFAGRMPIIGVCLGHQSIAQAFGGRIVAAKSLMHGKTSRLRHDGRGIFRGVDQGFAAMRYHSLAVERSSLPDVFEITAESEDGEIMGLRHKTLPIESVQYHPESIGTEQGMRQIANIVEIATGRAVGSISTRSQRKSVLAKTLEGHSPSAAETEGFFSAVMAGDVGEPELAAFLTALAKNPVTPDALAGAARAMRSVSVKIGPFADDAVDIVGTGGDGAVAKHGNVASTSACGSADVLGALGYNLSAKPGAVERCVREGGVGFMFAKEMHPAMRFAASVRRMLGFRTIFNLVGPLTNPAGIKRHVIGVPKENLAIVMAEALKLLGSDRALVVSGEGGLDEISPGGFTFVSSLEAGAVKNLLLDAGGEYGERHSVAEIAGGDAATNAKLLRAVLSGEERGAYRAAASENAAAAIMAGGRAKTFAEGLALAAESIDSGRALEKLEKMVELSNR